MRVSGRLVAGIGGIAFGVLTFVGELLASAPGGGYSASDVRDFVASGHRPLVLISLYLVMLATIGLVCLLHAVRSEIPSLGATPLGRVFWGLGVAAAACFAVGWALEDTPSLARLFGGGSAVIPSTVAYTISQAGAVVIFGPAFFLLGAALVLVGLSGRRPFPAWARWATVVAGIAGLVAVAFLPHFLVLLWALVVGIWLVLGRNEVAAGAVS
jgi:hypothetical protein